MGVCVYVCAKSKAYACVYVECLCERAHVHVFFFNNHAIYVTFPTPHNLVMCPRICPDIPGALA